MSHRHPQAPTFVRPAKPVTFLDVRPAITGFPRNLSWGDYRQVPAPLARQQDAWTFAEGTPVSTVSVQVVDNQYRVAGLRAGVNLVSYQTWAVIGRQTPSLLQHEQGHYDITGLITRDFVRDVLNLAIDVSLANRRGLAGGPLRWATQEMMAKITAIKQESDRLTAKLQTLPGSTQDGLYDHLTKHGRDRHAQATWDRRLFNLIYVQWDASFKKTLHAAHVIH